MKVSQKKIKIRTKRKTSSELVESIEFAKRENNKELLKYLSRPTREQVKLNLNEINEKIESEKEIIIPGKVLGVGELNKKVIIYSLSFSNSAEEKIKSSGSDIKYLSEFLKGKKSDKVRIIV